MLTGPESCTEMPLYSRYGHSTLEKWFQSSPAWWTSEFTGVTHWSAGKGCLQEHRWGIILEAQEVQAAASQDSPSQHWWCLIKASSLDPVHLAGNYATGRVSPLATVYCIWPPRMVYESCKFPELPESCTFLITSFLPPGENGSALRNSYIACIHPCGNLLFI